MLLSAALIDTAKNLLYNFYYKVYAYKIFHCRHATVATSFIAAFSKGFSKDLLMRFKIVLFVFLSTNLLLRQQQRKNFYFRQLLYYLQITKQLKNKII